VKLEKVIPKISEKGSENDSREKMQMLCLADVPYGKMQFEYLEIKYL